MIKTSYSLTDMILVNLLKKLGGTLIMNILIL